MFKVEVPGAMVRASMTSQAVAEDQVGYPMHAYKYAIVASRLKPIWPLKEVISRHHLLVGHHALYMYGSIYAPPECIERGAPTPAITQSVAATYCIFSTSLRTKSTKKVYWPEGLTLQKYFSGFYRVTFNLIPFVLGDCGKMCSHGCSIY